MRPYERQDVLSIAIQAKLHVFSSE